MKAYLIVSGIVFLLFGIVMFVAVAGHWGGPESNLPWSRPGRSGLREPKSWTSLAWLADQTRRSAVTLVRPLPAQALQATG